MLSPSEKTKDQKMGELCLFVLWVIEKKTTFFPRLFKLELKCKSIKTQRRCYRYGVLSYMTDEKNMESYVLFLRFTRLLGRSQRTFNGASLPGVNFTHMQKGMYLL